MVIREAVARAGVDPAADRRSHHGPGGAGRQRPGPGPPGDDPRRPARARSPRSPSTRCAAPVSRRSCSPPRPSRPATRHCVVAGRPGVDVHRAALRLRHAERHQGRQPDDGGRHDPRRPLGLLRLLPHGRVCRVHGRKGGRDPGRTRMRSPSRATARRWRPWSAGSSRRRSCRWRSQARAAPTTVAADEAPRKDTTVETLARLKPAFRKERHRDGGQRAGPERRRQRRWW